MERKNRLNANQLRELSDELISLQKQQEEARRWEIYIAMNAAEASHSDARKERISHISAILSQHDFKR